MLLPARFSLLASVPLLLYIKTVAVFRFTSQSLDFEDLGQKVVNARKKEQVLRFVRYLIF